MPWIQVPAASGQGNGSLPYIVAANPGTIQRSGQILIADQLITITQAAGPAGTVSGYNATLFAGGTSLYQDGAPAIVSAVGIPTALYYDSPTGNFYFADQQYQKVRVITPDGTINTVAPSLPIVYPNAITVDPLGNIYIGDSGVVWGVTQNGPFAGGGGYGFGGDNGPATSAQLTLVAGLAADSSHVYISDEYNARVRAVSGGIITTVAGGGTTQGNGGPATQGQLDGPKGLVLDQKGDMVFADGNAIRTVSQGIINTLPVTSGSLSLPQTLAYDPAGNLFITELGGPLAELSPAGKISFPQPAAVQRALSVAADPSGNVYVGDDVNHAVWKLTPQSFCSYTVTTPGIQPVVGGSLNLSVTTGAGCTWAATSDIFWILVSSAASVTGSGTVQLTIAPNLVGPERSAIIAIAGQAILVTQGSSGTVDFDGTGHSDIVLQDSASGASQVDFLGGAQGTTILGTGSITGANPWHIVAVADFNLDGHPDLVWQDPTTGQSQIWFMGGSQGTTLLGSALLTAANSWRIVAAADFNLDGQPDLVWQDPVSGHAQIWYLGGPQGATLTGAADLTLANAWNIVGASDFNGDGQPDLLWQDPVTGETQVWYLGGSQGNVVIGAAELSGADSWHIVAVADFNLDGHPDVVWQDPVTGESQVWFLTGAQGTTFLGSAVLTGANSWNIVAPR